MSYGMYVSAAGAATQQKRLEVLTNNLANVDTPGFKEVFSVIEARHSAPILRGETSPGTETLADIGGGVSIKETRTGFAPGPLRLTGNATDFSIEGDGFFWVQQGAQRLLTRAGNFRLDANGNLLTQAGQQVLSQEGAPIILDPQGGWDFEPGGIIRQGGQTWILGLVDPPTTDDLMRVGENLFRPLRPVEPVDRDQRNIKQGYLELSAVRPTLAMMELIETTRAFETNMRMIQNHDSAMGGLISRLLRA